MPTSTRAGVYLRFHDTLRQNCGCPTGGQGRPPLQNVVRFRRRCVQFCDSPCRVDVGIDPYKCFTSSHWCIRFCRCVLPGGQSRPPLPGAMQKQKREGQAPPLRYDETRDSSERTALPLISRLRRQLPPRGKLGRGGQLLLRGRLFCAFWGVACFRATFCFVGGLGERW